MEEYAQESSFVSETPRKNDKNTSLAEKFIEEMGWNSSKKKKLKVNILEELESDKVDVQEVLKKSVVTPEFEKQHIAPPFELSEKILKKQRKVLLGIN